MKGYDVQINQEYFEIYQVITNLPIPMYRIRSLENPEEGVIRVNFYAFELTKTSNDAIRQ